jgi:LacI family transcriptional regulator
MPGLRRRANRTTRGPSRYFIPDTNEREPLGRDVGVPVVYAYAPSADKHDISVISDNVAAGRMAAEHLISCGRQRIVYVSGNPTYAAARDRVEGAKAALADVELSLLGGEALYGTWNEGWGRGAVRTLLARFPDIDGILCGSDQIVRGALGALRDAGRDVPGDIAVMGHDNWAP